MADLLQEQVVQKVVQALDTTDSPALDVKPFQVHPMDGDALPLFTAWSPSEDVLRESGEGDETLVEAEVEIMVAGFVKGENPDADLSSMLKFVKAQLAAGVTLASGPVPLDYRGHSRSYEGKEADSDYSEIQIRFAAPIAYVAGAPDRLAWQ